MKLNPISVFLAVFTILIMPCALPAQQMRLSLGDITIDSLPVCGMTERAAAERFGPPDKIATGADTVIGLDADMNQSNLSTTAFYYEPLRLYFYTAYNSQWLFRADILASGVKIGLGHGIWFSVDDSVARVTDLLGGYMSRQDRKRINRGEYTLVFKTSASASGCVMDGYVDFYMDDTGHVREIRVSVQNNG